MSPLLLPLLLLPLLLRHYTAGALASPPGAVLITGATGRTGSALYHQLRGAGAPKVRALIRNVTKARARLGCDRCDASEGIYVGDVTDPGSLVEAFDGVETAVILTGSFPVKLPNGTQVYPKGGTPRDIDYLGTNNQVIVAVRAGVGRLVLVSSMGTTSPGNYLDLLDDGYVLSYKLNAEAYLMQTAASLQGSSTPLDYSIVKPSGLTPAVGAPTNASYVIGHSDCLMACPSGESSCGTISRDDLAHVLAKTVTLGLFRNTRYDLSSDPKKTVGERNWSILSKRAQDVNFPGGEMGCSVMSAVEYL
jgi:uncharacterized protein YbjT (DUF2867 family)